jgi:hypothetical protein
MVAAATRNYDLLVYTPTVDSDGFDLILDDRDRFIPLQIKSVMTGGKTTQWAIHRKLLRPEIHEIEWFGFEPSPCGVGRGGGVLLVKVTARDYTADVTYLYTDVRILTAYWLDLISVPLASRNRLSRLRRELAAAPDGKINVPRSAFLRARSPEHLLALAGLHSRYTNSWPHLLYELARHKYERRRLPAPEKIVRDTLQKDLESLVIRR